MPASHKPRRIYDPLRNARLLKRPSLPEAQTIFEPIYRMFRQMESGEVDAVLGRPVMTEKHGVMVEIAPALDGWSGLWDRMSEAEGLTINTEPLRRIARKLDAVSPLTESEVQAGKTCLDACYQAFLTIPPVRIRHHAAMEEIAINLQRAQAA
jgi:hypothetical protein